MLWHNSITDARGEALETLIVTNELETLNAESDISTSEKLEATKVIMTLLYVHVCKNGELRVNVDLSGDVIVPVAVSNDDVYERNVSPRIEDVDWRKFHTTLAADLETTINFYEKTLENKILTLTSLLKRSFVESALHNNNVQYNGSLPVGEL